jgi:hypothetical protein
MQRSGILTCFYTDRLFLPVNIIRTAFHKRNRVLKFQQSILLFMQIALRARPACGEHALVRSDGLLSRRKIAVFLSLREQIVQKQYGARIIVYG